MKFYMKKIKPICICLVALIGIYFLLKATIIREIIFVILFSFILAYTLKPIHKKVLEKVKISKRVLALLLVLSVIGIFVGILTVLIPSVLNESVSLNSIVGSLESIVEALTSKINMPKEEFYFIINNQFGEKINIAINGFTDKVFMWIIDFSENIIALAIVPIVAYYFLADGEIIGNKTLLFFKADKRSLVRNISRDIDKVLGKYIIGQFSLCLFVGILTFIGLFFVDIKFIILLSILNGMLNIVPYFGAFIGAVPAVFIALMDDPIKVVYVLILFIVIQQLEGNIIAPKITANSIKMHPLMVIILLLIGEKFAGLIGMVLIIPIGVVIKIIYEDIDYYLF